MNSQTVGRYIIAEKLGEGGMGVVYRARDPELGRDVAIKMLPEEYSSDPERLERLRREARSAAALNHPGICTIYEVGKTEDSSFISMEFVEGATLSDRITDQSLDPDTIIRYGKDLAAAIEHAHQKGVIHRDLKCSNVIITPDDHAKVLDFGLAKPTLSEDLTDLTQSVVTLTEIGTAVGTLPYIAPEVLKGEAAAQQSDIWSLGIMLYEMAAGRLPFSGQTGYELSSSILTQTLPPLSQDVPIGIHDVVKKCLTRDLTQRYQSAAAVQKDLENISTSFSIRQSLTSMGVFLRSLPLSGRIGLSLVGVTALAVFVSSGMRVQPSDPLDTIIIASTEAHEGWATISPNGERIGFTMVEDGQSNLFVRIFGLGAPQPIHEDVRYPRFSPDGNQFAFLRKLDNTTFEIYLIPATGGEETFLGTCSPITTAARGLLDWMPDGRSLVITDTLSSSSARTIFEIDIHTGEKTPLTCPPDDIAGDLMPRISPDGYYLGFARQYDAYFQREILIQDLRSLDKDPTSLRSDMNLINSFDWTPDSKALIVATPLRALIWQKLWWVSARGGAWIELGLGGNDCFGVEVASSGNRLVLETLPYNWHVHKINGPAQSEPVAAQKFIQSTHYNTSPIYSPTGNEVAMQATGLYGTSEIHVFSSEGNWLRSVTPEITAMHPGWSPDGAQISYTRDPLFNPRISIVPNNGIISTDVFDLIRFAGHASWSRDSKWLYFDYRSERGVAPDIYKVSQDGGETVRLTNESGQNPVESDDGQCVYYYHPSTGQIRRVPVDGGSEELVLNQGINARDWDYWNNHIVYIDLPTRQIQKYNIETQQQSHVADMRNDFSGSNFGFTVSPDGQWILYGDQKSNEDVIAFRNVSFRRPRR